MAELERHHRGDLPFYETAQLKGTIEADSSGGGFQVAIVFKMCRDANFP
jgi:hypothetical protein